LTCCITKTRQSNNSSSRRFNHYEVHAHTHKNMHPIHVLWGTRLGCSWLQSGQFLRQPCFSTGSKGTIMQKPGNAKMFGLS
jgi:hypothetical protein